MLVSQRGVKFLRGKFAKDASRDEQLRTDQTGHGEERSIVFDDQHLGGDFRHGRFLGGQLTKAIVAPGNKE